MGSFPGHVIPGTMFFFVGLWHIWSTLLFFVSRPADFKARTWHPCRLPGPLKYLELHLLVIGSFLDGALVELFIGTRFKPFENGGIAPGSLNNFEHATMLLCFFIFALAALLSETTGLLPLPEGALHIVVAGAFTSEFLLFSFHSTNHHGLEGRYHLLLSVEIAACAIVACLLAAFPRSFLLDIAGAAAVTLQGMWFIQTACSLFGSLVPSGCVTKPSGIHCSSGADESRGMALANLQFSLHLVIVLVVTLTLYALFAKVSGSPILWEINAGADYLATNRSTLDDAIVPALRSGNGQADDMIPLSLIGAHKPNGIFGSSW